MSFIDQNYKNIILSLTRELSERFGGRNVQIGSVAERVSAIGLLLAQESGLYRDFEIIRGVFELTTRSSEEAVINFRVQLLFDYHINEIQYELTPQRGLLVVSEKWLKELHLDKEQGAAFWETIRAKRKLELVILLEEGRTITYKGRILKRLSEKQPPLSSLTTEITLKFLGGYRVGVTEANLLLCGDRFAQQLTDKFKESASKEIDFTSSPISFEGFMGLLNWIETGAPNRSDSKELIQSAWDYLRFSEIGLLTGVFGKKQWLEQQVVANVNVPTIPEEELGCLLDPCPYYPDKVVAETHNLLFIPEGLTYKEVAQIANDSGYISDNVMQLLFTIPNSAVRLNPKEILGHSGWFLITKELVPSITGLGCTDMQFKVMYKDYQIPSLPMAIFSQMLPDSISAVSGPSYTISLEEISSRQKGRVAVSVGSRGGLSFSACREAGDPNTGTLAVRKILSVKKTVPEENLATQ